MSPVAGAVTFQVTDLSPYASGLSPYFTNFSYSGFTAKGISDNGQYISGSVSVWIDSWGFSRALAYRYTMGSSVVSLIQTDNYYSDVFTVGSANSVNNIGEAAGYGADVNHDLEEYASITFLSDSAPGVGSYELAIGPNQPVSNCQSMNNFGQMSATIYHAAGEPYTYLLFYDGATAHNIGLADQISGDVTAINDGSWIVGSLTDPQLGNVAFVNRPTGQGGRETVTLGTNSTGRDINNGGKIVGVASFAGGSRAFISAPDGQGGYGSPQDLGALGAPSGQGSSIAKAINNSGWIVGNSGYGFLAMDEGSGYVMRDLNDLLLPADQAIWTIADAYSIADTGQILVTATNNNTGETVQSLLLTPVPEPGTLVLLNAVAMGLLVHGRRRNRAPHGD
ncbi:MAG TPA: PEP-CTERM sorting domain-containing protein [Thermoguttaceae bacterium]|nr:PEP-CTERM sorting domain-containing protein [Thermoguttaceae bacterium]